MNNNTIKIMKNYNHQKINLRAELINALIKDGEQRYGGKNNATVKSPYFRINIGLLANKLVNNKI